MKVAVLIKYRRFVQRRKNKAQREYVHASKNGWAGYEARLDAKMEVFDQVLADLDRLIARNHDHWHDRRKKRA